MTTHASRVKAAYVDDTFVYKGQHYLCVGHSDYVSQRTGKKVTLENWKSNCADCGAEFKFKITSRSRKSPNRRCKLHQSPGYRVYG